MSNWHGGKGSSRRKEDYETFSNNYDAIFGEKKMKVTIYSSPNCSYCETVKTLSQTKGYAIEEFDISDLAPNEWIEKVGFVPRSVPQVFLNDEYIGGASDFTLKVMKNGNAN